MKENLEPFYNTQQIFIPPNFPHLLKVYAKAAIRTQPYDLLTWSASYFRALAEGKVPPVKVRLEYPIIRSSGGLSPGYLKLLIKQFSGSADIEKSSLMKIWSGICLNENELKQILCLAGIYNEDNFATTKFISVAAGFLTKNLTQTMVMLCELFTDEPDGGSAAISSDLFVDLYTFLAAINASKESKFVNGYPQGITPQMDEKNNKNVTDNQNIIKEKSFAIINEQKNTSDETAIFEELKDFVNHKNNSSSENPAENDSSDTLVVTSTDADEKHETGISTQSETESTQSSSLKKIRKTPAKFHEITEQESMSFDDAYKYSQDEFESPDTPGGEDSSFQVLDENGEISQKKDISVKERQAVIEQLQKNQDEKIKNMEAIMDSLEDLAEKSQINTNGSVSNENFVDNEKKEMEKEISVDSKIEVNPDAKGVVNPIFKGLFDNVADKMCAVNAFQNVTEENIPEIIIVPPIPGIGPAIDNDIIDEFLKYVRETASEQCNMFMPRDIRHYFCPPLEKN